MIKWSYSALKEFNTCPRQYAETRVKKNFVKQDNIYSTVGKTVHAALDIAIRDNQQLPDVYKGYEKLIGPLRGIPGRVFTEHKLALDFDRKPVPFDHADYWVRGIIDLLVHDDNDAYIVDYKTGNNRYADLNQLKLMALLVFHHFDMVANIRVGLLFLNYNDFVTDEYKRGDIPKLWQTFHLDLQRLDRAFEVDQWPANPNGLCRKFCPVTSCEFNGGYNAA